jgi:hypothetical protein
MLIRADEVIRVNAREDIPSVRGRDDRMIE